MEHLDWKIIAAVPPLLLWFGLFAYLLGIEKRLRQAQQRAEEPRKPL